MFRSAVPPRPLRSLCAFALSAGLSACAQFPQIEAAAPPLPPGPAPALLPIGDVVAQASATPVATEDLAASLTARGASLRAEAAP